MRGKEAYKKKWNYLLWCEVLWSVGLQFFVSDNFQGTFVDFRFMMFAQVLMNVLERILTHVRKILNCRISFKMLLSRCLVIIEKELWTLLWSYNFQNGNFQKITITVARDTLIKVSFPNVGSNLKKIKMNTQNTMVSYYHSKVRSTQNMWVPLFNCWVKEFSNMYPYFGKGKIFSDNSSMKKMTFEKNDIQH